MSTEIDPKNKEVLDKVAEFVDKRELSVIAIMLLESTKPLHYLGAQALLFFEPFLTILGDPQKIALFRESMEKPELVEYLVAKIEELSDR